MKIYKPFETLFCCIEKLYDYTGVGGLHQAVSGLVSTLQLLNIITIISLMMKLFDFKFGFLYIIFVYLALVVFNWIYFKDSKINEILKNYGNYKTKKKIFLSIISATYIILSFVLVIITFRK